MVEQLGSWLPKLLEGAGVTIGLTFATMPIALILGMLLALARLDQVPRILSWPAGAIVELLRGTPLLLQLFYIYFVLPFLGLRLDPFLAGIVGLSLNYAAYLSEVFRSGIAAIDKSQWEAGEALSMKHGDVLRRIILPQAVRIVVPPVGNYFVSLFKDTALVSTIGVAELLFSGRLIASETFMNLQIYSIIFVMYFLISFPAMRAVGLLEKRLKQGASV